MVSRVVVKIKQDNGEERVLGNFNPDTRTLYIERKRSKHFYRKLGAWGIDEKAFKGLLTEHGLEDIVLYDKDEHKRYKATAKDFLENGKYLHFKPHRLQLFLEERYWRLI